MAGRWRGVRLPRSAGVRLAAVYAGLSGLSVVALVLFLWWSTAGLLDRQLEAAIRSDVQGLSERWDEGGVPALTETVRDRLDGDVDDDALYLLAAPDGERLAGNLDRWPPGLDGTAPRDLRVSRGGRLGLARVQRYDLPGGDRLLVGRDVRVRVRLRSLLAGSLLWAGALAVLLGIVGAVLVRSLFRRMLANVSATARAISAGDLGRRVRVSGRGDEFDALAGTVNDMLDRIGRLMDGVRGVSNAIAHDLRTPITRARARLEDAAAHSGTEAELRAAVERAIADLDGVVAIFQALLRIAEIEAGARRSAFAPFDAAALLRDLAELYGAAAEEGGLTLGTALPSRLPLVGDRELFGQAVANLLDNALKFSPPGGTVGLDAETGDVVRVSVRDAGPGIPEADRAHAADRFFRGEAARSTPGVGLGLSLVQAVAQLHDGTLRLRDGRPGLLAELVLPAPG